MVKGKTMEPTGKPKLERIAYHEAGHAVTMHYFGNEIDELSIKPNINRLAGVKPKKGNTKSPNINPDEIAEGIKGCVIGFLGGLAAEHIYNGEPNKMNPIGSTEDLKRAKGFCRAFKLKLSYQDLIDWLLNDALELLKENWEAVEALSAALIQKGTISGEEAAKIIEVNIDKSVEK
jgi:ATP-dependent Zn protease